MKASDILKEAADLVGGDRHEQYGDAKHNLGYTAQLWSSYLCMRVDPKDVAHLMALLKMARTDAPGWKADSFIDGAAYMALAGEVSKPNND